MSDRIALHGIRVYGRHGSNPGEQDVPQPFSIDVEIEIDLAQAARSDHLDDTYDYDALDRAIRMVVTTNSYSLIERLAQEIADLVLFDSRVAAVTVSVAKPNLLAGATPSVTLKRTR